MTYAAVGLGAEEIIDCKGQLYGQGKKGPDVKGKYCCDVLKWDNALYRSIKGAESLRYHNEKRVRHSLNLLLDGGGLEQFAYSNSIGIEPGFLAALKAAAANYRTKFPKGRWQKRENGVFHPKCGVYSTWEDPSPPSAVQKAVINAVPRGGNHAIVSTMPDIPLLLVVHNGKAAPGGWLQEFIKTFKPKATRFMKEQTSRQQSSSPNTSLIKQMSPQQFQEQQQGKLQSMSTGQKVAAAAGVAALAGVGVWLWRTR